MLKLILNYKLMILKNIYRFSTKNPKLYVFGGQGTHEKGMLEPLIKNEESLKLVREMSESIGVDFEEIGTTDRDNKINKTQITQPLLVLTHYLIFKYERKIQLQKQDWMVGHSLGEYSALTVSGSLKLKDCLQIVRKRGQLMTQCTKQPHGMLIIKYKKQQQSTLFNKIEQDGLEIACYNTPTNIIVAGLLSKLKNLKQTLREIKISSIVLPVSTGFHCKMLNAMKQPFYKVLNGYQFAQPGCRIIRNYDSKEYREKRDIIQGLRQQLVNPVLFCQSVKRVEKEIELVEIGHKDHMSKFVEQIRSDGVI